MAMAAAYSAYAAPDYYLTGEFNGWKPNLEAYKFSQSGSVYTLSLSSLKGEFKITTANWEHQYGAGRTLEPGYVYPLTESGNGYNMKIAESVNGPVKITFYTENMTVRIDTPTRLFLTGEFNGWLVAPAYEFIEKNGLFELRTDHFSGNFRIVTENKTFIAEGTVPSAADGKLKITLDPDGSEADAGVVTVEDSDGTVIYYDLRGIEVQNPGKGIYIRRTGNKTEKIIR